MRRRIYGLSVDRPSSCDIVSALGLPEILPGLLQHRQSDVVRQKVLAAIGGTFEKLPLRSREPDADAGFFRSDPLVTGLLDRKSVV